MHRYFIHLAYNGTRYHGWQIQPNGITVQEEINKCLSTLLREEVNVIGCGRTDTGVHANDFYAHFDIDKEFEDKDLSQLTYKVNRFLKTDIYISEIFKVEEGHHTRFDALSREYKYYISKEKSPFFSPISYYFYGDLDVDSMNKACEILFEYNDFTSFSKLHTQTKTNNCKIIEANWTESNGLLVFTIRADRFLRNMVRAITGTMLSIGQGKLTLSEFRNIIDSKDRSEAGFSVPGNALFLHRVEYPQSILQYKKKKGLAQEMPFN